MSIHKKSRAATAALLALLTCATAAPPAIAKPSKPRGPVKAKPVKPRLPVTVGLADQHGTSFADPLFAALGLRYARLNLAWDALQYDWQVAELDAWMAQAHAAGVEPLVIFSQSRVKGRTRLLPTPNEFRAVVDQLLRRYPFVREFAAWNEANHTGQPTYRRPDMVAAYYKVLVRRCPSCKVLPASLLDNANIVAWATSLRRAIRRLGLPEPRRWGLHNYSDVNFLRDGATKRIAKAIKGRFWITESGGVVDATSPTASRFPRGARYAGRVTAFILGPMLSRIPQIERVYFYNWKANEGPVSWDSGLVAADGTPRPAYKVLADHLAASRIAAEREKTKLGLPRAPLQTPAEPGGGAPCLAGATCAVPQVVSAAVQRLVDAGLPRLN
jgi:hypothetical protein